MDKELTVTTERIDDLVLLISMMMKLGLPEVLDRHIPRHWLQEGLSWGWVATIWLAHIISQGDHRKLTVRDWVEQAHTTLEKTTGLDIRDTDFTDDRLEIVLRELSKEKYWGLIERDLSRSMVRVYDLEAKVVRVDATTVSGYHSEGGMFRFGKSKDNPALRQVKVMMGTLDPLGMPVATGVVSGERADDGLYIPVVDRVVSTLQKEGLLFVGDAKMSALSTRAHIHASEQHYLTPLAMTGKAAEEMKQWMKEAGDGEHPLTPIYVLGVEEGDPLAEGYERSRRCSARAGGRLVSWEERVIVVRSFTYAKILKNGLEKRLAKATARLQALTPPRGRGRRRIKEEAVLKEKADTILKEYEVEGLLSYTFERQVERKVKYVGRGRGSADRPQEVVERVRYQITSVVRDEEAITALEETFGWRAYVTDVPATHLSLQEAVLTYREEWRIESGFHRLKGAPLSISPMYVRRDDQITGLTNLLSIAVRVLTLIEFVVRRRLKEKGEKLTGLYKQNPKQATDKPTATRLLEAFSNITLSVIQFREETIAHITPLTELQEHILSLLGLSADIYNSLAYNST